MSGSSRVAISSWRLAIRFPLRSFCTALRFLTIIPVSWKNSEDEKFFQASVVWFPLIGLLIGSLVALSNFLVSPFVPPSILAVFAVMLLSGLSGFLHLDGVADSGDGLLSSRPREQALLIMRDSRSGAMGVILLIFLILGKYAALSNLTTGNLIPILLLAPVAGRTAILLSMAVLPYARKDEGGLGQLFYSKERYSIAGMALLFFIVCSVVISIQSALLVVMALFLTVLLFSRWCFVKLGGATGDTLGAVCEFSELSVAIAALCIQGVI
jgi:adenosylcobinamide-GDP ribazoletransferase